MQKVGIRTYFYVGEDWWNSLSYQEKGRIGQDFDQLDKVFSYQIYPILTGKFGKEWKPGIDNDNRITILIESMKRGAGGYFRVNDEYPRLQVPDSNEREMLYLNTDYITDPLEKSFLAHEFLHLITFNQKNRKY